MLDYHGIRYSSITPAFRYAILRKNQRRKQYEC
nr:MAG TPA: hypothetical protein [Caudoviricetes sp.]